MAKPDALDEMFDAILTELEAALELSARPDRRTRLTELAAHAAQLNALIQRALELPPSGDRPTSQNALD